MKDADITAIVRTLKREVERWGPTAVGQVAEDSHDPFRILISCLLSLRTKDEVTGGASARLFRLADTPATMLQLRERTIARLIYPVGFYRTKAKVIRGVCRSLIEEYEGRVPDDIDELLKLKGVGRKTANLVVSVGYGKPGICVDTHVHRISNRWGYVKTRTPEETEQALRRKLPRRHWIVFNDLLVSFGQNVCKPISPLCSRCPVERYCAKVRVTRSR
ncbi:MAG: endonuclease III [Candidatus Methylomirabilales bacterium]|nr:endonuclease III [candidate division NC10 bacterium]